MPRTAQQIVEQEVILNIGHLVATLAGGIDAIENTERLASRGRNAHAELSALVNDADELCYPVPDYEEAATQAGWERSNVGFSNGKDSYVISNDWPDLCAAYDIEPDDREVFEHWVVSDWLAERLTALGEKVGELGPHKVWARTTTGQAIYADYVIEQLVAQLAEEYTRDRTAYLAAHPHLSPEDVPTH